MNAFKTRLLVGLFVPAFALATGVASATGDASKVTGSQATTSGSTKTNDKSTAAASNTTGMSYEFEFDCRRCVCAPRH